MLRWIEKLLRIYWPDKLIRILARWIEEAVELLLRRNLESSMDRVYDKIYRDKRKKSSIKGNLLRICQEAVELEKKSFSKKGKTHKDECNNQATQRKIQSIY